MSEELLAALSRVYAAAYAAAPHYDASRNARLACDDFLAYAKQVKDKITR